MRFHLEGSKNHLFELGVTPLSISDCELDNMPELQRNNPSLGSFIDQQGLLVLIRFCVSGSGIQRNISKPFLSRTVGVNKKKLSSDFPSISNVCCL